MDNFLRKRLKEMRYGVRALKPQVLKEVAGDVAEKAYIRSDARLLDLVAISYSLAKLMEKSFIADSPEWKKFYPVVMQSLDICFEQVEEGKEDECYSLFGELIRKIEAFSTSRNRFLRNVVEKSRIKAATQVYAHGASLRLAASLSGVDMSELASYIGATRIPDKYFTLTVKERLKIADELFS